MTFMPNREELAWAAGFFDGEGNVGLFPQNRGRKACLHMSVRQVRREPLDRFHAAVGGLGYVYGPHINNRGGQDFYSYRCGGHRGVQAVMTMLWKFLSAPKREQTYKALSSAIIEFKMPRRHVNPWVARAAIQNPILILEAKPLDILPDDYYKGEINA